MDETQAFLMCVGVRTAWVLVSMHQHEKAQSHRLNLPAEIWSRCHRRAVYAATHGLEAVHQGHRELSQCALPC